MCKSEHLFIRPVEGMESTMRLDKVGLGIGIVGILLGVIAEFWGSSPQPEFKLIHLALVLVMSGLGLMGVEKVSHQRDQLKAELEKLRAPRRKLVWLQEGGKRYTTFVMEDHLGNLSAPKERDCRVIWQVTMLEEIELGSRFRAPRYQPKGDTINLLGAEYTFDKPALSNAWRAL